MNKSAIAVRLLILFASGGTLERTLTDLPMFKMQIEAAFDWLKTGGRCSGTKVAERATRLREIIHQKNQAIQCQDFDAAAKFRGEERALFESFWLEAPRECSSMLLDISIEEQTRQLSLLLHEANVA